MHEMLHYQIVELPLRLNEPVSRSELEASFADALKSINTTQIVLAPDGKPMNWYRQYLLAPANEERIHSVKGRIYLFQGEDDLQTPVDEVDRFLRAGRTDMIIHRYPGLGHGFSPRKEGLPTLGPIDSSVLEDFSVDLKQLNDGIL